MADVPTSDEPQRRIPSSHQEIPANEPKVETRGRRSNPVDRVSALRAALAEKRNQADPTPTGARRTTLR
jgi:hypothetical protein